MITRTQHEALLTLASALETCGAAGLAIQIPNRCNVILRGTQPVDESLDLTPGAGTLCAMRLRLLVWELTPKHIGS